MDVDNVDFGVDFVEILRDRVASCKALLVVIGRTWVSDVTAQGARRLDNPNDFVRIEVEAALKRNIRVIPVLVDGALMPRAEELPKTLKPLVRRQALEMSHSRFAADSERLVRSLIPLLGPSIRLSGGAQRSEIYVEPKAQRAAPDTADSAYGAYARKSFEFYEGNYLSYRRSFSLGSANFVRGTVSIEWSHQDKCLEFYENLTYDSDNSRKAYLHHGKLLISAATGLIHCLTIYEGAVRLLTLTRMRRSDQVMRGLIVTQSDRPTFFQPSVSAIYLQRISDASAAGFAGKEPGTLGPDADDYQAIRENLETIERDIVFIAGFR